MSGHRRMSDDEVRELLGAYALHACDAGEAAAVEAALARSPELAREARELVQAAAWIGAAEAIEAPGELRAAVLDRARARRAGRVDAVVDLYLTESDRFADAVRALPADALDAPTANGLSARDLVVHVAAQESLLAQLTGAPTMSEVDDVDIEARTTRAVRALHDRPLGDALEEWRTAVEQNRRWASDARNASVDWRGFTLSRQDAIVVRAFETWIHGNDLRRVAGSDEQVPEPGHLALMADLAGRMLGLSLAMTGRVRSGRTARLVLTGAGGGEWTVAMSADPPSTRPDVTLTADAVDWCRLVGDRMTPDQLVHEVEGDAALAHDLVAAAPALATL